MIVIGYHDMIIKNYTLKSKKIRTTVHIGIISDLHGTQYGKHQEKLIQSIQKQQLDIILFIGDIVDEYSSIEEVEDLLKGIRDIPSFYVLGNHEISSCQDNDMKVLMKKYGVHIIGQKYESILINDTTLTIAGIDDLLSFQNEEEPLLAFQNEINKLSKSIDKSTYSILLSHKPSLVDIYKNTSFDLIVSGHAHGGQWRIPHILNGLYAPDEHLFPHYAGGIYQFEHNHLLVGRGLVKNFIPRFFNPPELVVLTLNNTK